jgi:hypothetical protein
MQYTIDVVDRVTISQEYRLNDVTQEHDAFAPFLGYQAWYKSINININA